MNDRILISGGLGFLGFHLCRRLLQERPGCELTVVDNLSSTRRDFSALQEQASIVVEDFRRFDAGVGYGLVCHLAGPVGSVGILPQSGTVAQSILELAIKAAEVALASGAVLLHVSSSEVYGRGGPQSEDGEMVVPARSGVRMEYALGKLTAEHVLLNLARTSGLRLRICRPFNVIGEGQSADSGFVVPTFFKCALGNEPIPVHFDGRQRRSFCYVEDAVDGILAVLRRGKAASCYNVGHDRNVVTIGALAERIRDLCGSASPLEFVDPQALHGAGYVEGFEKIPSLAKVARDTGWSPRVSLDQALERIHDHYRGNGKA